MTTQPPDETAALPPLAQMAGCLAAARVHRFGDPDLARCDAQRGLDLLRSLQTPEVRYQEEEAEMLVILANADRALGRIEPAVMQCHAALKLLIGRPVSPVCCEAWTSLGWAYAQIGEFASALRYTMRGLKLLSRDAGARDIEAHALDVLGTLYAIFGDAVEALRHLDAAARIATELGSSRRLCSVLNNLAMTQLGKDDLASALASALESLRIARADALKVAEPNIVDTVASVLTAMGRFTDAEGYLVPAIAEARQRPPAKALANLLNNLGIVRLAAADLPEAELLHKEALDIAAQIGDPVLAMRCHQRLADLFAGASRWREAHAAFRKYHDLNQSVAGAKAAKRLTVARVASEIDALQDAAASPDFPAASPATVGAMEALIARLRAQNQELAEAKRAAEAVNETRSRFLANMSHELRTPLNGVLGMAHLLLGTPLNDKQARYCRTIVSSGGMLSDLITNLLDFTRLEPNQRTVDNVEFTLAPLIGEVVNALRPTDAVPRVEVTFHVDDSVPARLLGDPQRIRQLLLHLVGNAIKFTHEGAVAVCATCLASTEGDVRTWVRVEVRDTGVGIDPQVAAGLFNPFVQADDSMTRRHGGSGLGLAISRRLAQWMGGRIDFRSEPGKGSTFWFDIPLQRPS